MNKSANFLGLKNTTFSNPTGLSDFRNKSTCYELVQLAAITMK